MLPKAYDYKKRRVENMVANIHPIVLTIHMEPVANTSQTAQIIHMGPVGK